MRASIPPLCVALFGLFVGACAPAVPVATIDVVPVVPVVPVAGESTAYVQRFEISERTSEGEDLPGITIEQKVDVTYADAAGDRARMTLRYGDASVWIEGASGEPTFVATDAGAIARVFEEEEIDAARAYAALWAVMGHLELEASVDRRGVLQDIRGVDEVRRRRDGDIATDLGGSMLEGLISDPALLSLQTNEAGENRIGFRLAQWKSRLNVSAAIEEGDGGEYALSYESDSGEHTDGPFAALSLSISGHGSRLPGTGMPDQRTLHLTVSGGVPIDEKGTTRQDSAQIRYTLTRTDG